MKFLKSKFFIFTAAVAIVLALAASALEAKAVNKVEFHIAPMILGGEQSILSIAGKSAESLEKAWQLDEVKYTQYGKDLAFSGLVKYK